MPNLGPAELIVILAVALIVFGPKKLPEMGKNLGKALREFNKARNDFMDSLNTDDDAESARHTTAAVYSPEPVADTYATSDPASRPLEYPDPPDMDSADALPYGGEYHAAEGDSQPSYHHSQPEEAPVAIAANASAPAGDGKVKDNA